MPQNRTRTGRFRSGSSGNPGGRPVGLAHSTRELVGEDGRAFVALWIEIMSDPTAKTRDRLEASRLLADRGWGKTPEFVPDPKPGESSLSHDPVFRTPTRERMRELVRLGIEMELPGADETITEGVMRVFDVLVPMSSSTAVFVHSAGRRHGAVRRARQLRASEHLFGAVWSGSER